MQLLILLQSTTHFFGKHFYGIDRKVTVCVTYQHNLNHIYYLLLPVVPLINTIRIVQYISVVQYTTSVPITSIH